LPVYGRFLGERYYVT